MKKTAFLVLCFLASFPLTLSDGYSQAKPIIIRWSYDSPMDTSLSIVPERFKALVNKDPSLKDRLEVKLYPAGQLYKPPDALNAVMRGDLEFAFLGSWYLTTLSPSMAILDVPFVFPNLAVCQKAMKGEIGEKIFSPLEKKGLKVVVAVAFGEYSLLNNKRGVKLPAEAKGLKVRSVGISELIWKEIGAHPISLPAQDIYMGLERGTIDGADISIVTVMDRRLFEVAKYFIDMYIHGPLITQVVNLKFWNGLPPEIRPRLEKILKEAEEEHFQTSVKEKKEYLVQARDKGVNIHTATPEDVKKWAEATQGSRKKIEDKMKVDLSDLIAKVQTLQ